MRLASPWSGAPATTAPPAAARPVVSVTRAVCVAAPVATMIGRSAIVTSPLDSMLPLNTAGNVSVPVVVPNVNGRGTGSLHASAVAPAAQNWIWFAGASNAMRTVSAGTAGAAAPVAPLARTVSVSGSNVHVLGGMGTRCASADAATQTRNVPASAIRRISVVRRAGLDPGDDRRDLVRREAAARRRNLRAALRHLRGVI